ncbi:Hypp1227 [Branchiostoma lanceolatum]|uniref:Hypp1227 protein n=1 Tax=Branchiostoma lanceolatum TaxID=7740 RepID=A0A8J9ZFK6_BRALA|nr:Hypp1227 [Branchiostoma lanceolatum]
MLDGVTHALNPEQIPNGLHDLCTRKLKISYTSLFECYWLNRAYQQNEEVEEGVDVGEGDGK